MQTKVLILSGEGINCERETAFAFEQAGAHSIIINLQDFLELESLDEYSVLVFPGGFSYGDEIKSGKILAELLLIHQKENIEKFIAENKPILGICNGFQTLIQLGVFDHSQRSVTLAENSSTQFCDQWVECEIKDKSSFWFKNMPNKILIPIRHKEGMVQIIKDTKIRSALEYTQDVNGSYSNTAGLINEKGNILGLMPHPEAAINNLLLPYSKDKTNSPNITLQIFKNAVNYCQGESHVH